MRRIVLVAAMVVLAATIAGSAGATSVTDLIVGQSYWVNDSEALGSGVTISQDDPATTGMDITTPTLYSMPYLTFYDVTGSTYTGVGLWGVCIDTKTYTVNNPQILLNGWYSGVHVPISTAGRYNGTVLDETAWRHTTYLFGQYGSQLGAMTNPDRFAFQAAIWEVMSGDGSSSGGTWGSGNFKFSDSGAGMSTAAADTFVKAAFNGGYASWVAAGGPSKALYVHDHQDFLVWAPAVPEFPAVALAPLGLAALGLLKRRCS